MKTNRRTGFKRRARSPFSILLPTVCSAALALAFSVSAAEETTATDPDLKNVTADGTVSKQASAAPLSPRVAEVIKMVDAEVSTQVIVTYIESAATAPQPTEQDIIAMKEHKVDDEIVKLLLKRGAAARIASNDAKKEALLRVVESRRATTGGIDAESYDYFRAYYLQPRAMAAANQRLYPYYGVYGPRSYRYGAPAFYGAPIFGQPPYYGYR